MEIAGRLTHTRLCFVRIKGRNFYDAAGVCRDESGCTIMLLHCCMCLASSAKGCALRQHFGFMYAGYTVGRMVKIHKSKESTLGIAVDGSRFVVKAAYYSL